jgi:hypothetical protein
MILLGETYAGELLDLALLHALLESAPLGGRKPVRKYSVSTSFPRASLSSWRGSAAYISMLGDLREVFRTGSDELW